MGSIDDKIPKARHILELTALEKKNFLDSFDLILCDCDGVVWLLIEPIPNTGEAITLLKNAGKQYKFISNNSNRTDEDYISKLTSIGVKDVEITDIVHPVKTITRYLKSELPGQKVYSLCCRTMNEEFIRQGIDLVTVEPCTTLQTEDLADIIKPNVEVSAVIIDLNFNLSYVQLARAQQYLLDERCLLIVGASDKYVPIDKGLVTIASAGFINLLRDYSNKQPILLGKPGPLLGRNLIELFNITDTKRTLFIGDSLSCDIQFGVNMGFQTLFVLSGSCTKEEMLMLPNELKPDYIADGLADFIEFFKA